MRVGVVLGAGGPLGWAYHLGVVQGVRDAIGREPANADRVVGTSAGAAIAATLLAGTPTDEVIELISSPPSDADREQLRSNGTAVLRNPIRALRPVAPSLILGVRHVGAATALAGLLPAGLFPTVMLRQFAVTQEWPPQLWVPSVRLDGGRTVVFGRDQFPATLGDALEATSAIPGVFQPKTIDGARYVDGAVASSTHADTLLGEQLDIVLISAPSARGGGGPLRARARRSLEREDRLLRASGARTRILVPNDQVLEAAEGFPRKRLEAAADIVEASRQQTIAAFRSVPLSDRREPDSCRTDLRSVSFEPHNLERAGLAGAGTGDCQDASKISSGVSLAGPRTPSKWDRFGVTGWTPEP